MKVPSTKNGDFPIVNERTIVERKDRAENVRNILYLPLPSAILPMNGAKMTAITTETVNNIPHIKSAFGFPLKSTFLKYKGNK
jgi:hypothetical protein